LYRERPNYHNRNKDAIIRKRKYRRRKKIRRMIRNGFKVLVIFIVLGGCCFFLSSWGKSFFQVDKVDSAIRNNKPLSVDPYAGALITPSPAPTEPGIAIDGWSKITIPANSLEATVSLYNPKENEGWYYLTYELRLEKTEKGIEKNGDENLEEDTGEVIFTTGLIPPGLYCNKVVLTRELEPGIYPAILHVQPYRMDEEMSPTNNADLELVLVVK